MLPLHRPLVTSLHHFDILMETIRPALHIFNPFKFCICQIWASLSSTTTCQPIKLSTSIGCQVMAECAGASWRQNVWRKRDLMGWTNAYGHTGRAHPMFILLPSSCRLRREAPRLPLYNFQISFCQGSYEQHYQTNSKLEPQQGSLLYRHSNLRRIEYPCFFSPIVEIRNVWTYVGKRVSRTIKCFDKLFH